MGNGMYIVVANFDPPGNYGGQFGANVLPPGTKPPVVAGKKETQQQTQSEPPPTSKLIFHIGFNCSNCEDDPIIGIRYQCTTCDDYDLCEKCHKDVTEKVNDIIKKFDVDGDGIIEYPEYWIMAKKLWKITDEKQIREGFDAIDKSGDGKITAQEFRDFYMGVVNEDLDEYLDKMIQEFDVDENGVIEYPEFWMMAKKLWKELDEKAIKHDFKTIDKSGDGKLSLDELRAYFKEHTSKKTPEKQEVVEEEEDIEEEEEDLFQQFKNVQPGGTTWYTTTYSPQQFTYTSRGG
uniref:Uncharacterized protein n=1 Tax=Acrobeloides nanus TaxID=290746 RepID=A0A914DQX1_9BILA